MLSVSEHWLRRAEWVSRTRLLVPVFFSTFRLCYKVNGYEENCKSYDRKACVKVLRRTSLRGHFQMNGNLLCKRTLMMTMTMMTLATTMCYMFDFVIQRQLSPHLSTLTDRKLPMMMKMTFFLKKKNNQYCAQSCIMSMLSWFIIYIHYNFKPNTFFY